MRDRYHIKLSGEDIEQFLKIIAELGVKAEFACSIREYNKVIEADYIVELSKYELLYLRLACKSGKIINIANAEI